MKPEQAQQRLDRVIDSVTSYFVGDRGIVEKVLAGALSNGHILFEDNPGLGKTLLVKVFAAALGLDHTRVQFTPDVLPGDIIGSNVWVPGEGKFRFVKGPIFTHILLADEINRAPPKSQSALLEAMEERQVTIEGNAVSIRKPFFVLATQNPIEQEGTYPLPEAQVDRFLMRLSTGYPKDQSGEREILKRRIGWKEDDPTDQVRPVLNQEQFLELQAVVEDGIFIHDAILDYIAALVRGLRAHPKVEVGPSPRGSLALLRVGRALAVLRGRKFVIPDDVLDVVTDTLAHRTLLHVDHMLEGVTPESVVKEVVDATQVPTQSMLRAHVQG